MRTSEMLVNYEAYLSAARLVGHVDVTLPNIQFMTQTIQGNGLSGPMDVPVEGHIQDMTLTINFRNVHDDAVQLLAQQRHHIEFWGAIQKEDTATGQLVQIQHKVIVKAMPKGSNLGTLNPGNIQGRSVEFGVSYLREFYGNEEQIEIDKFNFIYKVRGADFLAGVRAAIGL
jgi:P2 family phage contractile tail tube protein